MVNVRCPSCGANVTFQSGVSIMAVCEQCQSTIVRHDLEVEAVGRMATLQPDGSPLQIGSRGVHRDAAFTVVGRIQLRYDRGIWNEWHLLFADGKSGWLGEAQGTYAVSFRVEAAQELPSFESLKSFKTIELQGQRFQVENIESAHCIAGQGELPFQIEGGYDAPVADLLGDQAAFATIDYSEDEPLLFVGRYVDFDDLRLTNLREFNGWTNALESSVRSFRCTRCGGAITQRALRQTTSVVCPSCAVVVDISNEELRIISTYQKLQRLQPVVPLGTRGTFPDGTFEAIGFMQRYVAVEGVNYYWREYLLFNPFKGFRWLSEYNGHWNYIRPTLERPEKLNNGDRRFAQQHFRHFQTATATVDYVFGEFYWRVEYGESCLVEDFVAPPRILSVESVDHDVAYSVGEYLESNELRKAFALTAPLPSRVGVGGSQPSPNAESAGRALRLAGVFVVIAILIQVAAVFLAQDRRVALTNFAFNPADLEKSAVSEVFDITGHTSNVLVRTRANVNNSWIYVAMALVNDDTGTAYDFGREVSYFYGRDSDGAWSEGSQSADTYLGDIPAGRYYLRVEPEGTVNTQYSVEVYRDVPRWWPLLVAIPILVAPALILLWLRWHFEVKRWSESDHPMVSSGDDE